MSGHGGNRVVLHLLPLLLPYTALFVTGIVVTLLQSLGLLFTAGSVPEGAAGGAVDGVASGAAGIAPAYREIFSSPGFFRSLRYSLWVAFASASAAVGLGTFLAIAIWRLPAGIRRAAVIYKLPLILPPVSVAFLMLLLFSQSGLLASLAYHAGLIDAAAQFPDLFYNGTGSGIILSYIWKETPFAVLMIIALLYSLDERYLHSGRMLGGGPWYRFRRIIFPHIAHAVHTTFIILFLYSFGAFDVPYLAGESAPQMLSIRVFNLYFRRELALRPQAMAILVLMLLFAVVCIIVYLRFAARMRQETRKL